MDLDVPSRYLFSTGLTATGSPPASTTARYSNHTRAFTPRPVVNMNTSRVIGSGSVTAFQTVSSIQTSTTFVTYTWTPTPTPQIPPMPTAPTTDSQRLSSPAAIGVGVSIGVVSIVSLVCLGLLFYRHKRRQSSEYRHYQQAKLWKGFTPQTQCSRFSAASTFDEKLQHVYVAELPVPPSPLIVISAPSSSGSRMSWNSPLPSPFMPRTRPSTFIELPP